MRAVISSHSYRPTEPEIAVVADVESIVADWDDLADCLACPPFMRPDWVAAWLRAFGQGSPRLLTVRRGTELVGVLPMCLARRRLEPAANWHTPQFGPLATDEVARAQLLRALFEQPQAAVELNLLDGEPERLEAVAATARASGRSVVTRAVLRSPFVELEDDFERYERRLSRNRRRALRRQRHRLEERGTVRLDVDDGGVALDERLDELFRIEAAGWKGRRGTAIASRPETRAFYREVAHWAADRGWLRLAFLRVDDRAIACDYALECDGVWYSLKAGYDEELRSFGPGAVMLRAELEHCFQRGLSRLDLLGNDDSFKLSWTDCCTERYRLEAFRPTPTGLAGLAVAGVRERLRPLVRRLRARRRANTLP